MDKKRLNIAIFIDSFFPVIDGVVRVVDNYARILSRNHDVTVFAPASPDKSYVDDFPYNVVRIKLCPFKVSDYPVAIPSSDKRLKAYMKNHKFDIVHLHSPFFVSQYGLKYAKKNNIPVIMTCHSQYQRDFYQNTKSAIISKILLGTIANVYNNCDELWTMNFKMKELVRSFGYKGIVKIVPHGSEIVKCNFTDSDVAEFRKTLANDDEKILLFVGRICKVKNIDFSLRVCKKLYRLGFKFKMIFIGSGSLIDRYIKKVQEMKLSSCVKFIGGISDKELLAKYYSVSDLFVFPSKYDSDGLVKREAATYFTPTIFLENTIISAYVKDGETGYVGGEKSSDFAKKIISIFDDPETYEKVSKNANASLVFSWERVMQDVEKGYFYLIDRFNKESKNGTKQKGRFRVEKSVRMAMLEDKDARKEKQRNRKAFRMN